MTILQTSFIGTLNIETSFGILSLTRNKNICFTIEIFKQNFFRFIHLLWRAQGFLLHTTRNESVLYYSVCVMYSPTICEIMQLQHVQ